MDDIRGWATFAWQADYSQFYLVDGDGSRFLAPEDITPAMVEESLFVPPAGLTVYTADCLQQQIRITIYAAAPERIAEAEPMSDKPWTRVRTVTAHFPSRRFTLSSPSTPTPLPCGPLFLLDSEVVTIRISWLEFQGIRDDSVPVEPDVIDLAIWPA